MVEVSEIVTGHPLIPVSTDTDFPFILSPVTLLSQKTGALLPLLGEFSERDLHAQQWRQVQALADVV